MTDTTIPERHQVSTSDMWNLSPLFETDEAWEALFSDVENQLSLYETFRGKLHESFETFQQAINHDMTTSRNMERLYTYAHLKEDEDKTNQRYSGFFQRAMNLYSRVSEASSFMVPEIQSLEDATIRDYMAEATMAEYRFFLEKIVRNKPHTRSQEIEQILAMASEITQAPRQAFGQLDNADLNFGTITDENGNTVELSHGNFISFLSNPSPDIRKTAFTTYYSAYKAHKHTLTATLASSIKKDVFQSRVRSFASCRRASLFADNVPDSVYDNLLDTVKSNLDPLFRYLTFRKKALNLPELHFYDTYVPVVSEVDFSMTFDEAAETCIKALAPLGDDYTTILANGFSSGWVDRYENKGKRSGAYSSGCYDSPPYILMNYDEKTINSLYTLIHEAGHSMHSYYSKQNQPFVNASYTIFVAEVASTLNEILLGNYLLKVYGDDPKMKAYIINREIDNIRGTLFRQTMFADFELITHTLAEQNKPLTLDVFTSEYRTLLATYFGETMVIDEDLCLECFRIPHFYSAFYVYKYATGIAASIAIANRILTEGQPAVDDYLSFLKLGGSKFPIDELLTAGVDMAKPEPVEGAIGHFAALVEQLESLWDSL